MRGTAWNPDARNRAVEETELLRGVAVVWMPVQDIERAKGFYRDTLGLQITNEDGESAEMNADGLTIGLNGREPSGAGSTGGSIVTFRPEGSLRLVAEESSVSSSAGSRDVLIRAVACRHHVSAVVQPFQHHIEHCRILKSGRVA
jgi:predicted enzyme related to lactoylglutathione lyase